MLTAHSTRRRTAKKLGIRFGANLLTKPYNTSSLLERCYPDQRVAEAGC